ncbi:tRNA (pseudouridine(54)-N(1))-methyltransferase [subsurface metagenome]
MSRCVLSAITNDNKLEKNIQIWAFLDKYGTFVFNSNTFNNDTFPKNEILLTDYFVDFIKKGDKKYTVNPLDSIKCSNLDIFEAIKKFIKKKYQIFVLNESGVGFSKIFMDMSPKRNLLFIVGDQSGELINSKELKELKLTNLSLGNRSYLASSTIRLIKLNLSLLI